MNRQDRNCYGGGVLTFIRSSLKPISLNFLQDKYVQKGLEITLDSFGKFVIVGIYRPPSSKCDWFILFNDLILELSSLGGIIIL